MNDIKRKRIEKMVGVLIPEPEFQHLKEKQIKAFDLMYNEEELIKLEEAIREAQEKLKLSI